METSIFFDNRNIDDRIFLFFWESPEVRSTPEVGSTPEVLNTPEVGNPPEVRSTPEVRNPANILFYFIED